MTGRYIPDGGPARDVVPVVPSDTEDLQKGAAALYVTVGGALSIVTLEGQVRQITVPDYMLVPVQVLRVNATGTTAGGIHALIV